MRIKFVFVPIKHVQMKTHADETIPAGMSNFRTNSTSCLLVRGEMWTSSQAKMPEQSCKLIRVSLKTRQSHWRPW
jgi:hypothetical protein